jgi:KDO2-lipid IV(A) lauroyltransferase
VADDGVKMIDSAPVRGRNFWWVACTDSLVAVSLLIFAKIPHQIRVAMIALLYRLILIISARYRHIAHRNIALVFPDKSLQERRAILRRSAISFARMVSDIFRLAHLSREWFEHHVQIDRIEELKALVKGRSVLYLGGHLASFDLMVAAFGVLVQPVDFIVRENKSQIFEQWSTMVRTRFGNGVISRTGGLRRILTQMKRGRSVGFLFDQNVTRNHAVFVPWFGRLAATTAAPGMVAERVRCPVIIVTGRFEGDDRYSVFWEELDLAALYRQESSPEEVRRTVCEFAVAVLERVIKEQPEDWFWLHRRWKTAPEGLSEDFYC